ncbi:M949_RS01915 family surface polysaccharide biosynthesis protein [Pedobacter duraquae]|uniref:Lipoprotein n=1 Tax=Pedobacter duraquae TaxID=425511 RepID=A0A4R6IF52_9SPHI|nr:hypothetical protein [Pedobacter duraquae]TDO19535.1 hypothetical protein CLV32_4157 [Pedobacter duraquae]
MKRNIIKTTIICLALISIFQSCTSDSKKQNNESKNMLANNTASTKDGKISTPVNISIDQIPPEIKYEGKIKTAVQWTDQLGENIVLTTETGIYQSKKFKHESDGEDAELFAYHFIKSDGSYKQTWKVYDYISDCPFDVDASFIDKAFTITDLNHNGTAEIWLMYRTVCQSDLSPSDMKIIMYEGQQKFAVRGESKVMHGIDDNGNKMYMGGEYKIDDALSNGPKVFLDFAQTLWDKHMINLPQ